MAVVPEPSSVERNAAKPAGTPGSRCLHGLVPDLAALTLPLTEAAAKPCHPRPNYFDPRLRAGAVDFKAS